MFCTFQGCRAPVEEEAAGEGAGETGASDDSLTADACAAYWDLEGVLETRTSDELWVMWAALDAMPEADDPGALAPLGVSEATTEFLQTANEDEGTATAFILAALLDRHHPDLMDEMSGGGLLADDEFGGDLGDAFAQGMFKVVLEGYEEGCAPVSGG